MTAKTTLSPKELWPLIGNGLCPLIIDARTAEDFAADPRLVPTALRRPGLQAADWAAEFAKSNVVVYCEKGLKISQGAAAWLRHAGAAAATLEDGFQGWRAAGLPLVPAMETSGGETRAGGSWVSRDDPGCEALASAWLIRRFVDPQAVFLFVAAGEVPAVADRFTAQAFALEGEDGGFAALLALFGLKTEPLQRFAKILEAARAPTNHAVPEAAGLRALAHGLALIHDDDLARLEAALPLFDALYRWACDDAADALAPSGTAEAI